MQMAFKRTFMGFAVQCLSGHPLPLMNVSKEGLQCVIIVPVVVLALIITVDGLKALRAKKS